ncbi:MAG: prepilin-type N-terminal cleavage/methylation domain-containing protein [Planctomycetota bacterium]
MARKNPIRPACERGFSLIEILVAIGIITLLVGLAIPVFSLAYDTAKSSQAQAALNALKAAEVTYESATGLRVFHLDDSADDYDASNGTTLARFFQPTDWGSTSLVLPATNPTEPSPDDLPSKNGHPDGYPEHFIERFIALVDQRDESRSLWRSVDNNNIVDTDGDGFAEVTDPWGTPIVYAAFVSHRDSDNDDNFLEQRGDMQAAGGGSFVPKSPAPVFVSAGPDRDFGDVNGSAAEQAAAEDNLYSDSIGKGDN